MRRSLVYAVAWAIWAGAASFAQQSGDGASTDGRIFVRGKWLSRSEYLREREVRQKSGPVSETTQPASDGGAGRAAPEGAPSVSTKELATDADALTKIYRVGLGDVLDIRVLNAPSRGDSTLYTVLDSGHLEFPLVGPPLMVAGLTLSEIAARLTEELKKRAVYENPIVTVTVRAYVSHSVIITGMVNEPGMKSLRREAVPLYVVLAEAQPRPEAGLVTIISSRMKRTITLDLTDPTTLTALIFPGDLINVMPRPPAFLYIGGEVNMPGQIDYHPGLRLTQAILAAGGARNPSAVWVRVSRQKPDGRLTWTQYNLQAITDGVDPDPELIPGDRIEVGHRRW
jgi:protein involved in polysaccharide export with SLBB domain